VYDKNMMLVMSEYLSCSVWVANTAEK